ncbi:MAG: tRNA dihydrouridine synthase DusB [Planctomycetes bacterium]|nr:tRNA dihydrouridine synthase DusB [Planctomycetota bacterium]
MRIGDFEPDTNLLLSPIAGYCDLGFRLVVRSLGGLGLAYTDLLSPQGLLRRTEHSLQLAATCPEDQPLGMQLYGRDPALMADGARWAADHGARVIDLNMGCPADKVVKKDGGVALMAQPERAVAIARAVVQAVALPVTAKMRLGCDASNLNAPQLARMLEDVGIQAITVHGRTGAQRFGGSVDLDGIAAVVQAVRGIPVIGNGDIKSPADARRMIDRTGCAGLMIGRRALSDPWIFRDTHAYLTTGCIPPPPTLQERVAVMVAHFENLRRHRDDRAASMVMRQRTSWYARMLPNTKRLQQRMNRIDTPDEFYENIDAYLEENAAPRDLASSIPL